jgi:chromosome partitioning protein
VPNLTVIPATPDLSSADVDMVSDQRRVHKMRQALAADRPEVRDQRFILIDCPPSLNLLTINALVAADSVLVPLQCEFFALEGLSQLMRTVQTVRASSNPALKIQGIVLTMYDRRNNLSGQVAADVRDNLGTLVYDTVIPRNVRLSEAPSHAVPALIYDRTSSGSLAYQRLAGELLARMGRTRQVETV